ncbi:MAG: DUF885 family protein [Jatrophihabitans sp.]|uniref:DUF885 family protein n=1 Tax=Jatrophihabitans sp. TaxID=1932789 RepID=UPI0039133775
MALEELAERFWTWRTANQPDSYDDITRVIRPLGWTADWSPESVAQRRAVAAAFADEYAALDLSTQPVHLQVNGRLLGSAVARARWELELVRGWARDPRFYLDQSLVPIFNLLLEPPPFDEARAAAIVAHLRRVPAILAQARANLAATAAKAFATYAVRVLDGLATDLDTAMAALQPYLPAEPATELAAATAPAAEAVADYRHWLQTAMATFVAPAAVGADAFGYFLHRVALLPYGAAQLRTMAAQEWNRAVATEAALQLRTPAAPPLPSDLADFLAGAERDELAVRRFYVEHGLLSQPDDLRHYRFAALPPYLVPLHRLGVTHYAADEGRRHHDAVHYVPALGTDDSYFRRAEMGDPRASIVHEGVHAQQLALGWAHPDPVRRRYYDSTPMEGLAFYNEELMLVSGLFDGAPAAAEFVANAMRLRALRVEVDVALGIGEQTLDEAADTLADMVPMDRGTAEQEAPFFAGNPGQGSSYQIGKLQILDLIAAARLRPGFDLQPLHDRLWREGNVPLVLQRWEVLGSRDQLDEADRLAADF